MKWNYVDVNLFLADKSSKLLPNLAATELVRGKNGEVSLHLYGHKLIVYHPDNTFNLSHGGFKTRLTQNRLCEFGPAEIVLENGEWFLQIKSFGLPFKFPFKDGMRVNSHGYPVTEDDI